MRTDSTQVAQEAQHAAREVIQQTFGPDYLPERPPFYAKKAKGAQEAHEAIRPTKPGRDPESIKQYLNSEQYQLYRLIWRRFIASQMSPALVEQTTVDVLARPISTQKEPYYFRATGERIVFPGFIAVYQESRGDSEGEDTAGEDDGKGLPKLEAGDPLDLLKLLAEQHFTQPLPRFGEATLVKALEELGVGRPSTYATILSTIQERGYVVKLLENKERKFRPTALGRAVNDLLVARFPDVVDVQFTAHMESELDEVAEGKRDWTPLIAAFYGPMMEKLTLADREVAKITVPAEDLPTSAQEGGTGGKGGWTKGGKGSWKSKSRSYPAKAARSTFAAGSKVASETSPTAPKPRRSRATATNSANSEALPAVAKKPATTRSRTKKIAALPAPVATEGAVTEAAICPLCGKGMVRRKGPYSEFYGCSGYPGCKGTRKI